MKYQMYVNGKPMYSCDDWYEAHRIFVRSHNIQEWCWLPIYVSINGVPQWGNTPEEMKNQNHANLLNEERGRYLHESNTIESEREIIARQKLTAIVATAQAELKETQSPYD